MYIFRNNSIHFLINFLATGITGCRFSCRFGLFFHLKCSNYGAGGSVLFQLPFLSHWVICFTLIELWLLPAGVDSLSELVSLSSFRACFLHHLFHRVRPGLLEPAGPGGGSADTGDPGAWTMGSSCLPRPGRPPSQMGGPFIYVPTDLLRHLYPKSQDTSVRRWYGIHNVS